MTIFGIGPILVGVGATTAFAIVCCSAGFGISGALPTPWRALAAGIGSALVMVGMPLFFAAILAVAKIHRNHKLITIGVFGISRNPLYTSLILFLIPGSSLIMNRPLMLLVSAAMYAAFKLCVSREEQALKKNFGREYEQYRKRVNQFFPTIRLRRH